MTRHDMLFLNDNNSFQKIFSIENKVENEKIFETSVRYNKERSKKISSSEFYRFQLQVS